MKEDGLGCHGCRGGNGSLGNNNDRRGMIGSSCRDIVVTVAALGFVPAVMMQRILEWRQRLRQSERESGERTTGRQCGDNGDGWEW